MSLCIIKHYFLVSDACFLSIADNLPVASLPECGSLPESRMSDFSKVMQDELPSSEVSDSVEEKRAREVDLNVSCIDGGINMNCGTLKKRLQGKKHRPKVFKEEKTLRTPTSETALQERKENTSCKRKYVRRKKDASYSSETAFNALGEIVDSETYCEAAKSVRRCLNFGSKEQRNVHEFSAAMSMFNKVLRTHALEASNEETNYSRVQSELLTRPSAGAVYDISNSVYQPQNECSNFLQIPVPYSEVNKNICASVKHRTSLKSSVKHFKALARENACLSLASANARSDQNSNKMSDAPSKGTKRDHLSHDEAEVLAQKRIMHSYNLGGCFRNNYNAKKKNSCLEGIHNKGKIMEKLGKNDTISPKFVCTSWKTKQLSNSSQEFDFTDAQGFLVKEVWDSRHVSSFQKIERYEQSSSVLYTMNSSRKPSFVRPSKQKNQAIIQSSISEKLSKSSNALENNRCGSQAHLELSENTMKPLKTSTNMKTKKQDGDHRQMAHLNGVYSAQNIIEGGALATSSWNGKNLHHETITVDYPCTCYCNVFHHASLSSETSVPFIDLLDDGIKKLRHLSISSDYEVSGSQAQNSIVPYANQGGKLVVYEGNFNMIKRRRPRAKVDLDPESNRVWKLLMGKDCGEGDANSYVDKEKWWDEERRVFQGRVDSFIARMHLVQGDRRFSQWKGSVVDSVVGVFLTQNVSDHLSSSAFMSLAANFPLSIGKCSVRNGDKDNPSMENQSRITSLIKTPNLGRNLLDQGAFQCFLDVNVVDKGDQKESKTCSETVGVTTAGKINYYSRQRGKGKTLYSNKKEATISGSGANLADLENIEISDCGFTAQNSAVSSQNSVEFYVQPTESSNLFLSIETDDLLSGNMSNEAFGSSSFTQIFQMEKSSTSEKFYNHGSGMISTPKNQESILTVGNNQSFSSQLDKSKMTIQSTNDESSFYQAVLPLSDRLLPRESCKFDATFSPKRVENNVNLLNDKSRSHLLPAKCKIISGNEFEFMSRMGSESEGSTAEPTNFHKLLSSSKFTATFDSCVPINKLPSQMELDARLTSVCHKNTAECFNGASKNENQIMCSGLETENMKDRNSEFEIERTHNAVQSLGQIKTCRNLKTIISNNKIGCNLELAHKSETYRLTSPETLISSRKPTKRKRPEVEKNTYDWESLRKEVCNILPAQERSRTTLDSLDWEAVRIADVSKISEAIRERGMNNVLAERIKEFLNRLVREHGSTDLEWLRDIPPDKVKDYLLSIRGLGLKSAECVRLLTLQQLAFPVDTNVGRICVRLGWVPLQPLPESLQLHLLEMYPVLETIQKYLWPRLCKLDQRTLYELHYQMITFGKVFCTKSKPNCNSCPMKGDCKHFASAFASARLYLPAPEDRSVVSFTTPMASEKRQSRFMHQLPLPQLEGSSDSKESTFQKNCEPIVEEPVSPEPECPETLESAIEDAFYEDSDEIPTIKLNFKEFTQNLHNYMEENMKLQDASLSKALVALNPEIASISMPKLKNVSRLRTEHQVYEIPDTHPLLERVDPREPDDPSPYLLAIWTPGETAQSTEPPKVCCNTGGLSQLCETKTCFTCNCMQDSESHRVRGTLLIPCRTATRGSFPLNGTYFQVNEVFADHHSSCNPIYVPREWIWNLPRRTVYFGTSIPTIFRGLTTEEIQQCFWRGFVCVRGFDRITRAPKPLYARLHLPASKAPKNRKAAEPNVEN